MPGLTATKPRALIDTEAVYAEYGSDGRIHRLIMANRLDYSGMNALERMAYIGRFSLHEFDVEWCQRDERYYYHEVGSWWGRIYLNRIVKPHRSKFWARDDIEFCHSTIKDGKRRLSARDVYDLGYDRWVRHSPPDLTEINMGEDIPCAWCEFCQDMLPEDDLCCHQHFCDDLCEIHAVKTGKCPHCGHE